MPSLTWEQLVALQRGLDLPDVGALRFWPAWHDDAACAGSDANFFPQKGGDVRPAKAVCAACPVRSACLSWALDQGVRLVGVWGGTTARERRRLRGRRSPQAA